MAQQKDVQHISVQLTLRAEVELGASQIEPAVQGTGFYSELQVESKFDLEDAQPDRRPLVCRRLL